MAVVGPQGTGALCLLPGVTHMKKITILVGLAMSLALALPDSTEAASFNEVKKLTASDAQHFDRFGISVAVSGDTAVVGAWLADAGVSTAGAAYVFQRDEGGAGNWGEVKKLTASDAQGGDNFGGSVAVSDDSVTKCLCGRVLGVRLEDSI